MYRNTTNVKIIFTKLSPINLQVKKLSSMFVSASNKYLVVDEIRPLKQTLLL